MTSRNLAEHLPDNPLASLATEPDEVTPERLASYRLGGVLALIAAVVGIFVPLAGAVGWAVSMAHAHTSGVGNHRPRARRVRTFLLDLAVVAIGALQVPYLAPVMFVGLTVHMLISLLGVALVSSTASLGRAAGLTGTERLDVYVRSGQALSEAFATVEVSEHAQATDAQRRAARDRLTEFIDATGAVPSDLRPAFTLDVIATARALARLHGHDDSGSDAFTSACYVALVEQFITERSTTTGQLV